ncbi:MAG: hypothetical protein AMS25_12825 [Gemmatimonas sp. SM23_52]|nr:MAG: hypothetical protein AMS25_12825 [Gemmatimonas sp. SM23_52]
MCGLAGIIATAGTFTAEDLEEASERMITSLRHRGPDDSGIWVDASAGIALGFRRLAIIDLSEHGHQPMHSPTGRFTVVFNGEVYNYRELRQQLQGFGWRFRGHSDTEVILAAFDQWGVEQATRRLIGMFAMGVWDAQHRTLSLIRDRLGIKPLFVYSRPGVVAFASELKALRFAPLFDSALDMDGLAGYLRYLYVPAPHTIFSHVKKLLPGHILTVADPAQEIPAPQQYWSAVEVARNGVCALWEGSEEEAAIRELEAVLSNAVAIRMHADVPLGALLSGGIDSSTVVSIMQEHAERPVKTYSIGFEGKDYNEAPFAARVAAHLGTDHTELMLTGADALELVPRLPDIFDEPFADPSQIPTYLVCALARREVTVALSGDGGDEVFGGYNRYWWGQRVIKRMPSIPRALRCAASSSIGVIPQVRWDRYVRRLAPILPEALHHRLPGEKLHKVAAMMRCDSPAHMYRSLLSAWQQPDQLVLDRVEQEGIVDHFMGLTEPEELLDRMMLTDQVTYLPDDLLAKVDRASMAVSLEVRVPVIDHRVLELAWRLPMSLKFRNGQGKWVLRQILYRRLPRQIVDRPKMGFSAPIDSWLRGPLSEWAEDLLSSECFRLHGALRADPIRQAWNRFQAGRGGEAGGLWGVLMFQAWSQRWLS